MQIARYYKAISQRLAHPPYPTKLIWFVTEQCNLHCPHCFVVNKTHQPRSPMPVDAATGFIRNSGLRKITFTGGEPMILGNKFEALLDEAFDAGIDVAICSNGFRNDILIGYLKWRKKKVYLQVSLDGTKAVHNAIRGNETAYDDAMRLILNGRTAGHRVGVVVTVSSANIDCLDGFLRELADLRLVVYLNFIRSGDAVGFVPNQKNDLSVAQMQEAYSLWGRYNAPSMPRLDCIVMRIKTEQVINFNKTGKWTYKCAAGRRDAVMYPNGDVSICEMRPPIGNIMDYDMNWKAFWRGRQEGLKSCFCQWDCAMTESLTQSYRGVVGLLKAAGKASACQRVTSTG